MATIFGRPSLHQHLRELNRSGAPDEKSRPPEAAYGQETKAPARRSRTATIILQVYRRYGLTREPRPRLDTSPVATRLQLVRRTIAVCL